jgi:hypothetical protein
MGAKIPGGGSNCYLVIRFTNTRASTVSFDPADLRMVDQSGDTYSPAPVFPQCYDSIDVNASESLRSRAQLTFQLCFPVMTGALPQQLVGTRTLNGLRYNVPQTAVLGTWGGS